MAVEFLKTGIDAIDDQHRQLVDAFARLETFTKNSVHNFAANVDALTFLRRYLSEHFTYEEQVLAERNYPKLDDHVAIHKAIAADVQKLWNAFENGDDIGDEVIASMRNWVVDHINKVDAEYADYFAS